MFLARMKRTKVWFVLLPVLVIIAIVLLFRIMNAYKNDYYEKMHSYAKETKTCTLEEVFDFQFEKAYIVKQRTETYADWEYFSKKLNVEVNSDVQELSNEDQNRILFIENGSVIFDYKYSLSMIEFNCEGIWLYPQTPIKISSQIDARTGNELLLIEIL